MLAFADVPSCRRASILYTRGLRPPAAVLTLLTISSLFL